MVWLWVSMGMVVMKFGGMEVGCYGRGFLWV